MNPNVIIFDLDMTLARSKEPLTAPMAELLSKLITKKQVAITTGGSFSQIETQVLAQLPKDTSFTRLFLMPTSGASLFYFEDTTWRALYEKLLSDEEEEKIEKAVIEGVQDTGLIDFSTPAYGERIEDRGTEVTLSALGQKAPIAKKEAWDPKDIKRPELQEEISERLPEYDVKIGGSTSIDITKHGVNKAYGIRRLSEHLSIPIGDMLYIGDALFPGGNDEVVKETGITTQQVTGPEETEEVISTLLKKV